MMTNEKMDIDIVVLWVDGNDPEWQKEKVKYQGIKSDDSNSVIRFRDWGLMRYWFRAVEKFLPWVRTVHFVTCGHVPDWLNPDCPKLHHVRHEDYIPNEFLPTFSANTIEMNIHRIPNLAEQFIFFNDDTFVLRPMKETAFFKDGLPCYCGSEIPVGFAGENGVWQHLIANDMRIVNNHFNKKTQVEKFGSKYVNSAYRWQDNVKTRAMERLVPDYFTGFRCYHAPTAFLKSTFETLWKEEPEVLEKTSGNRFRAADDVNQWLAIWWQLASGNFSPAVFDSTVEDVMEDTIDSLFSTIVKQRRDMICINDPSEDIDFEALSEKLNAAFNEILPDKSEFEK